LDPGLFIKPFFPGHPRGTPALPLKPCKGYAKKIMADHSALPVAAKAKDIKVSWPMSLYRQKNGDLCLAYVLYSGEEEPGWF